MFNNKKMNSEEPSIIKHSGSETTQPQTAEQQCLTSSEEQKLLTWLERLSHADCTRSETGKSPLFAAVELIQKKILAIASELAYSAGCIEKSSTDLNRRSSLIRDRVTDISKEITEMGELSSGLSLNMSTVASATEELSINMKDIAHAAEENRNFAAQIAHSTTQFSESAREIVAKTSRASHVTMKAKKEALDTMARVAGLETATNEIGEVTEAIAEIAEQTKLLALNATIEAARAGVAGRGFAVVAKEVKELALQTNNATIDIRERINAIQEESRQTISAINSISTIIEEVAGVVTTIEHSSHEQSSSYEALQEMTTQNNIRVEQIFTNVEMGASAVQDVNVTLNEVSLLTKKVSSAIARISDDTSKVSRETVSTYAQALENSGQGKYVADLLREMTLPPEILRIADSVNPELCRFTPVFSVSVEQYDDDHRKIFSMINEIHRLVKEQKDGGDLLRVMKELAQFCVGHFDREEVQMKRFNYPDYDNHKRIHENLLGKVTDILAAAERGDELDLIAILSFLKEWLYNHIQGVDKLYSPFLNEHGYR